MGNIPGSCDGARDSYPLIEDSVIEEKKHYYNAALTYAATYHDPPEISPKSSVVADYVQRHTGTTTANVQAPLNENQQWSRGPQAPLGPLPPIIALNTSLTSVDQSYLNVEQHPRYRIEYDEEGCIKNGQYMDSEVYDNNHGEPQLPDDYLQLSEQNIRTVVESQDFQRYVQIQQQQLHSQVQQHHLQQNQLRYGGGELQDRLPVEFNPIHGVRHEYTTPTMNVDTSAYNNQIHTEIVTSNDAESRKFGGEPSIGNEECQDGIAMPENEDSNDESKESTSGETFPLYPKKLSDTDERSAMTDMAHDGDDESTVIRRRDGLRATTGIEVIRSRVTSNSHNQADHEEPIEQVEIQTVDVIDAEQEYSTKLSPIELGQKNFDPNLVDQEQVEESNFHVIDNSMKNDQGRIQEAIELAVDEKSIHAGPILDDACMNFGPHTHLFLRSNDSCSVEKRNPIRVDYNVGNIKNDIEVNRYTIEENSVENQDPSIVTENELQNYSRKVSSTFLKQSPGTGGDFDNYEDEKKQDDDTVDVTGILGETVEINPIRNVLRTFTSDSSTHGVEIQPDDVITVTGSIAGLVVKGSETQKYHLRPSERDDLNLESQVLEKHENTMPVVRGSEFDDSVSIKTCPVVRVVGVKATNVETSSLQSYPRSRIFTPSRHLKEMNKLHGRLPIDSFSDADSISTKKSTQQSILNALQNRPSEFRELNSQLETKEDLHEETDDIMDDLELIPVPQHPTRPISDDMSTQSKIERLILSNVVTPDVKDDNASLLSRSSQISKHVSLAPKDDVHCVFNQLSINNSLESQNRVSQINIYDERTPRIKGGTNQEPPSRIQVNIHDEPTPRVKGSKIDPAGSRTPNTMEPPVIKNPGSILSIGNAGKNLTRNGTQESPRARYTNQNLGRDPSMTDSTKDGMDIINSETDPEDFSIEAELLTFNSPNLVDGQENATADPNGTRALVSPVVVEGLDVPNDHPDQDVLSSVYVSSVCFEEKTDKVIDSISEREGERSINEPTPEIQSEGKISSPKTMRANAEENTSLSEPGHMIQHIETRCELEISATEKEQAAEQHYDRKLSDPELEAALIINENSASAQFLEDMESKLNPSLAEVETNLPRQPMDAEYLNPNCNDEKFDNLTVSPSGSRAARALALASSTDKAEGCEIDDGDFEGIDIKFVEQYEETFNAFLSKHPHFEQQNPEYVEIMRVAKLQKLLTVTADVEEELLDHIETLEAQKKHTTSHYHNKLLEAAKKKAAREIQLQQELNTIQQATQLMESKLTWQIISRSEARAKKYVQMLEKLDMRRIDENNPLSILPDTVETQPIIDAINAPSNIGSSQHVTEEQMKDLRQFQVDNAFLNAETMVLERKLAQLKETAKQYAWIDSVLRRLSSKQHKMLKHRYQNNHNKKSPTHPAPLLPSPSDV